MFSGIVENIGIVQDIMKDGENLIFSIKSPISKDAYIDQSIAHNGVCLTVTSFDVDSHRVTAINETLLKTNLAQLKVGDRVNLERSLQFNQRVDALRRTLSKRNNPRSARKGALCLLTPSR